MERKSIGLRVPVDIHQELVEAAAKRRCAVNWLIVYIIEQWLKEYREETNG